MELKELKKEVRRIVKDLFELKGCNWVYNEKKEMELIEFIKTFIEVEKRKSFDKGSGSSVKRLIGYTVEKGGIFRD